MADCINTQVTPSGILTDTWLHDLLTSECHTCTHILSFRILFPAPLTNLQSTLMQFKPWSEKGLNLRKKYPPPPDCKFSDNNIAKMQICKNNLIKCILLGCKFSPLPGCKFSSLPGCSSSFLTAVLRAENVCQTLPVLSLEMHIILCLTQIETQNKHRDKEKTQRQTHHKNK